MSVVCKEDSRNSLRRRGQYEVRREEVEERNRKKIGRVGSDGKPGGGAEKEREDWKGGGGRKYSAEKGRGDSEETKVGEEVKVKGGFARERRTSSRETETSIRAGIEVGDEYVDINSIGREEELRFESAKYA